MIHLAILALLYFLPTIIASNRGHGVAGILLLNLFLGWTGIGWIIMLLWALLSHPRYCVHPYYHPPNYWRRW
jgi:Superinfection immunity protein